MHQRYQSLRRLIEEHREVVNFAQFGSGTDESLLQQAESTLGFLFPPSYRWWLQNYGGGEICGEEIFSVYELASPSLPAGDVVYMNTGKQKMRTLSEEQIVICVSDVDGAFFFDASRRTDDGECPVVSVLLNRIYAVDFLDFLRKRINNFG
ncbi:MAG: SMI1/KNR4 family protein [Myxococcota bacterium]|jgi:hypothetical protein|nr:SMI1/KNR4 family protein [Myxococcota bacterium]